MPTLYGLPHCGSCQKARGWLDAAGIAHSFVDYRSNPPGAEQILLCADMLGWSRLVNRASTTWRLLPEGSKQPQTDSDWLVLVQQFPTLLRRPLLIDGEHIDAGFKPQAYAEHFRAGPNS